MSKLIDMLSKGKGDIAEVIAPLVDAGMVGQPSLKAEFRSEGAPPQRQLPPWLRSHCRHSRLSSHRQPRPYRPCRCGL
jgi:hypothetical protein